MVVCTVILRPLLHVFLYIPGISARFLLHEPWPDSTGWSTEIRSYPTNSQYESFSWQPLTKITVDLKSNFPPTEYIDYKTGDEEHLLLTIPQLGEGGLFDVNGKHCSKSPSGDVVVTAPHSKQSVSYMLNEREG